MTANKELAEHAERRAYQRYNCEALIKWSYFNKAKLFDARLLILVKTVFLLKLLLKSDHTPRYSPCWKIFLRKI